MKSFYYGILYVQYIFELKFVLESHFTNQIFAKAVVSFDLNIVLSFVRGGGKAIGKLRMTIFTSIFVQQKYMDWKNLVITTVLVPGIRRIPYHLYSTTCTVHYCIVYEYLVISHLQLRFHTHFCSRNSMRTPAVRG